MSWSTIRCSISHVKCTSTSWLMFDNIKHQILMHIVMHLIQCSISNIECMLPRLCMHIGVMCTCLLSERGAWCIHRLPSYNYGMYDGNGDSWFAGDEEREVCRETRLGLSSHDLVVVELHSVSTEPFSLCQHNPAAMAEVFVHKGGLFKVSG